MTEYSSLLDGVRGEQRTLGAVAVLPQGGQDPDDDQQARASVTMNRLRPLNFFPRATTDHERQPMDPAEATAGAARAADHPRTGHHPGQRHVFVSR
ncbi:hypothetical protein [Micromonospora sediminimaris]|uniref:hypothetical protein n=1 Tax=Micromonospora sediminimaris TaxID=547162 RepID=UPI000B8990B8|nr:hypothetical protein [Micromonospora sediminimaris]